MKTLKIILKCKKSNCLSSVSRSKACATQNGQNSFETLQAWFEEASKSLLETMRKVVSSKHKITASAVQTKTTNRLLTTLKISRLVYSTPSSTSISYETLRCKSSTQARNSDSLWVKKELKSTRLSQHPGNRTWNRYDMRVLMWART